MFRALYMHLFRCKCVVKTVKNGSLSLNATFHHFSGSFREESLQLGWYKENFPRLIKLSNLLKNVDLVDGKLVDVNDNSTVNDERLLRRMYKFKALSRAFLGSPSVQEEVMRNVNTAMAGRKCDLLICFTKLIERDPIIIDTFTKNDLLEFGRVLKAKEQVVAGKLYHPTLEVVDAGKKTIYEAKVCVKPWMNFKQFEEFKRIMDSPHFTTSDLGFVQDGFGWRKVLVHDPEIQDAANHAVMAIQQSSNSLFPYKLLEIQQAEAEVVNDIVEYNPYLKMRGNKDEKLKVIMHKNSNGGFVLTLFEA